MKLYLAKIVWTIIGNSTDYKLVYANNQEEAREKVIAIYSSDGKPDFVLIEEPL